MEVHKGCSKCSFKEYQRPGGLMTTTFWNSNEGKSVPSGGSNQLTTAAGNGTNTGNWLSAASNVKAGLKLSKLVIAGVVIAANLYFILKKRRK